MTDEFKPSRQVTFDKVSIAVQRELDELPFLRNHVEVESYLSHVTQNLVLQLKSCALGKVNGKISLHRQWPADWWQAVKQRWFPKRCLKRWPVRYERVNVEEVIYRVCPHLDIKTQGMHVAFLERGEVKPVLRNGPVVPDY